MPMTAQQPSPFNDLAYATGRWEIYRQDAGMGEKDYCVLRNGGFFCRTDDLNAAKNICAAIDKFQIRLHTPAPASTPTFEKLPHPWIHRKKCWTPYFNEMKSGRKKFDKRVWDTDYQEGDALIQEEWNPDTGYTGDSIGHVITYILRGEFAEPGVCLMSVDGIEFEPREKREQAIRDYAARTATLATLDKIRQHMIDTYDYPDVEDWLIEEIMGYLESLRQQAGEQR